MKSSMQESDYLLSVEEFRNLFKRFMAENTSDTDLQKLIDTISLAQQKDAAEKAAEKSLKGARLEFYRKIILG